MHFLSVKKASKLLGLSTAQVYNLIEKKELNAIKITPRNIRIDLNDLVEILKRRKTMKYQDNPKPETAEQSVRAGNKKKIYRLKPGPKSTKLKRIPTTAADYKQSVKDTFTSDFDKGEQLLTFEDIKRLFKYSYGRFYNLRFSYKIPCIKIDKIKYFPMHSVETAINEENSRLGKDLKKNWYSCGELMELYGLGKTQVRRFSLIHGVRSRRIHGNRLFYLKSDWNAAREKLDKKNKPEKQRHKTATNFKGDWYTVHDIMRIYSLGKTQVYRFARKHDITMEKDSAGHYLFNRREWDAVRQRVSEENPRMRVKKKNQ
jgi:excisionase family DNA binding protein